MVNMLSKIKQHMSVEVTMFLYMLAFMFTNIYEQEFFIQRACLINLDYPATICSNISFYPRHQEVLHRLTSWVFVYEDLLAQFFPMITAVFIGSWTDKFGRKWPLIVALCGKLYYSIVFTIHTMYPWPLEWLLITATLVTSFSGSDLMIFAMCFAYLSDITTLSNRTLRICILEAMYLIAMPLGISMGLYAFKNLFNRSYTLMFTVNCCLMFLSVLYSIVFLKNNTSGSADYVNYSRYDKMLELFNFQSIIDACQLFRKPEICTNCSDFTCVTTRSVCEDNCLTYTIQETSTRPCQKHHNPKPEQEALLSQEKVYTSTDIFEESRADVQEPEKALDFLLNGDYFKNSRSDNLDLLGMNSKSEEERNSIEMSTFNKAQVYDVYQPDILTSNILGQESQATTNIKTISQEALDHKKEETQQSKDLAELDDCIQKLLLTCSDLEMRSNNKSKASQSETSEEHEHIHTHSFIQDVPNTTLLRNSCGASQRSSVISQRSTKNVPKLSSVAGTKTTPSELNEPDLIGQNSKCKGGLSLQRSTSSNPNTLDTVEVALDNYEEPLDIQCHTGAVTSESKVFKLSSLNSKTRYLIIFILLAMFFYAFSREERMSINLYTKRVFEWTPVQYSHYSIIRSSTISITLLIILPIFSRLLKVKDFTLAFVGCVLQIIAHSMYYYVINAQVFVIAGVISGVGVLVGPLIRAIASKLISKSNRGKLFALLSICENASPLISSISYSTVYRWTLNSENSGVFMLTVIISVFVLLSLLCIYLFNKCSNTFFLDTECVHGKYINTSIPTPENEISSDLKADRSATPSSNTENYPNITLDDVDNIQPQSSMNSPVSYAKRISSVVQAPHFAEINSPVKRAKMITDDMLRDQIISINCRANGRNSKSRTGDESLSPLMQSFKDKIQVF